MTRTLLIAGGGIAGLATAVAAGRSGWQSTVYEQAGAFAEAGAGIQLGPNATRRLHAWNLREGLAAIAGAPAAISVRDARSGDVLARMPLGAAFEARYGAPYLTAHRADLHELLREAAVAQGAAIRTARTVVRAEQTEAGAWLQLADGSLANGDAVVGADGLWSTVRAQLLADAIPRPAGHLAYRALVARADAGAMGNANEVGVWLGPRLHVVAYPVRQGAALNVVVIVEGDPSGDPQEWDARGEPVELDAALRDCGRSLRDLLAAAPQWRRWSLHDRPAASGPHEMARQRIALVGDAAHPMLPYLAQGAAMAIEDAAALGAALQHSGNATGAIDAALASFARGRWQRNAKVQRRAQRNARIFHANGALRLARDAALRVAGPRLLDIPWLFRGI